MCRIKILNTTNGVGEYVETSARNFGALKAELRANEESVFASINWDASKVVLKDSNGKRGLIEDSSPLSGDSEYKIFVVPAKFDSGAKTLTSQAEDLEEELEDLLMHLSAFKDKVAASESKVKKAAAVSMTSEEQAEARRIMGK